MPNADDLRQYIEFVAQSGSVSDQFLLKHGKDFEWSPRPPGIERDEAKMCYSNAGKLVLLSDFNDLDLTYYEGYVSTSDLGIPIPHAWCVDQNGRVVDPTLRGPGDTDCGYCFGNGTRMVCDTGDIEPSPKGAYGSADPECEECFGEGCHEVECFWCGGSGQEPEDERDLTGTVYFGVPIEKDTLRRMVVETGTWGVLYKAEFYET